MVSQMIDKSVRAAAEVQTKNNINGLSCRLLSSDSRLFAESKNEQE